MKRIFATQAGLFLSLMILQACSHSAGNRHFIPTVSGGENYRPHPSSYVVDLFPVEREVELREPSSLPFYFKQCTRSVGRYIGSNTQYECD